MANRMFEIAETLGALALTTAEAEIEKLLIKKEINDRKLSMTIAVGGEWPGSNADKRKSAEEAAYAADPTLIDLGNQITKNTIQLLHLEADRANIIAVRDAWIWTIRDQENVARGLTSAFELGADIQ